MEWEPEVKRSAAHPQQLERPRQVTVRYPARFLDPVALASLPISVGVERSLNECDKWQRSVSGSGSVSVSPEADVVDLEMSMNQIRGGDTEPSPAEHTLSPADDERKVLYYQLYSLRWTNGSYYVPVVVSE